MDNGLLLFLTVLVSAVGTGYFVYGKKQAKGIAMLSGLLLCIYPYFITNVVLFLVLGIALVALPFLVRY